jgi:hypothetical protein
MLFAKMANVRNHNRGVHIAYPLKPHEGLPGDLTYLTQCYYNWDDKQAHIHHVGWLDGAQINELSRWFESEDRGEYEAFETLFDYVFDNGWFDAASMIGTGVIDVRFIFWFDN